MITLKVEGLTELTRNLGRLLTEDDIRDDLETFRKRGERRRLKGLGGRRNTVTAKVAGDKMVMSTTLNNPRTSGRAWQKEFQYAIFPAMAKRVFRARAKKIEERFKG